MPISNFPGGFANGLTVRNMPVFNSYSGNNVWVDSGSGSDGNPGTFDKPYATVDYAISRGTANSDYQVHIKAGHNEGGIAPDLFDIDIAGVSVIGHGRGASRPTFDFDDTDVTIGVSAEGAYLHNVILRASITATVTGILVDGQNCHIDRVSFQEELRGTDEFINAITTTGVDNSEDGLTVTYSDYLTNSTEALSFVDMVAATTGLTVVGNVFVTATTTAAGFIGQPTAGDVQSEIFVVGNYHSARSTDYGTIPVGIEGTGNHTGIFCDNRFGTIDPGGALIVNTGTTLTQCENYVTADADLSGAILPAAGAH